MSVQSNLYFIDVAQLLKENADLKDQIIKLNGTITDITSRNLSLTVTISQNNAEIERLREENIMLKEQLAILQNKIDTLINNNQKLTVKVDSLTNDNQKLTANVDSLTNDNQKLTIKVDSLTNDNQKLTINNQKLTKKVTKLTKNVNDLLTFNEEWQRKEKMKKFVIFFQDINSIDHLEKSKTLPFSNSIFRNQITGIHDDRNVMNHFFHVYNKDQSFNDTMRVIKNKKYFVRDILSELDNEFIKKFEARYGVGLIKAMLDHLNQTLDSSYVLSEQERQEYCDWLDY